MTEKKIFYRKTKRGNVLKTVREVYLRRDIPCGAAFCKLCPQANKEGVVSRSFALSASPTYKCSLSPHAIFLIPDTNVVLRQIDFLEHSLITNVIILSTVLNETRHQSLKSYRRLRECIANPDKKFFTFVNDIHKDTYVGRAVKESANDWNDRMIRSASKWYAKHLFKQQQLQQKMEEEELEEEQMECEEEVTRVEGKVLLLTDDKANKELAIAEGIEALSVKSFVKQMEQGSELIDLLHSSSEDVKDMEQGKRELFPEHLTLSEVQKGLREGSVVQGSLQVNRDNCLEAFVSVHEQEKQIFIQGRRHLNRGIHGDVVAVRVLPKREWKTPSSLVVVQSEEGEVVEGEAEEEKEQEVGGGENGGVVSGEVVAIIRRNWRQYCGVLQHCAVKGLNRHLFIPAEKRIPKIGLETRSYEQLKSQRLIVVVDAWPRHCMYPQGHLVRRLGEVGERDTENEVLLLEHDVPHKSFSQQVLACLPSLPWIITPHDMEDRKDLRGEVVCSVDPPGCTDIDDALHSKLLPDGSFEVGVHIADVSHFIRPGTALDEEAALRGTTVYLIDKRIDMVPERLSSNLCSLKANEERFAFSVIWRMDKEARVLDVSFTKSLIKSQAALTYAEAQMRMDDPSQEDPVTTSLRNLNHLAKHLRKERIRKGALTLASAEIRFHIDSETHDPIDVQAKELRESNWMVEEFMLLANTSTASHLHKHLPSCSLLRRHPSPPLDNFQPLVRAAQQKGFTIDVSSGKALADSLDKAVLPDHPYFNVMLRILATRCMMQAVYFCSGTVGEEEYHHYGLASPIYTHFTSPIRRYSDVLVHRLLAVIIGVEKAYPDLMDKNKIQATCNNLNYRHKMAQYAGRASVALYTQIFFKKQLLHERGYVLFVKKNALQVLLPRYGLEGNIFLHNSAHQPLGVYDDETSTQRFGEVVVRVFDEVLVQVAIESSGVQHHKLSLKLIRPQIEGLSVPMEEGQEDQ